MKTRWFWFDSTRDRWFPSGMYPTENTGVPTFCVQYIPGEISDAEALEKQWEQERIERDQAKAKHRAEVNSRRIVYPLSCTPSTGIPIRRHDRVIVFESFGKTFYIDEDMPSVHGSHLLGHEGESCCYCYFRDATPEEIAQLEAYEQKKRDEQAALKKFSILVHRWKEAAECPAGNYSPEGEILLDTQTIYGGGSWFVFGEYEAWYIRNNGSDGDDWSRNNIRTGGAGAIGYRLPAEHPLVAEARTMIPIVEEAIMRKHHDFLGAVWAEEARREI